MDKLPNVFANPITKKIDNVQDTFYGNRSVVEHNPKDINKKINEIFASLNHIYKSKVHITTKNGEYDAVIVGKTNINLLTIDGKLIKITDIIDIKKN